MSNNHNDVCIEEEEVAEAPIYDIFSTKSARKISDNASDSNSSKKTQRLVLTEEELRENDKQKKNNIIIQINDTK